MPVLRGAEELESTLKIHFVLIVAAVLFLAGCPQRLDGGAQFYGQTNNPLAFEAIDVNDRPVSIGHPGDSVMVLFFSAPATSDAMQPITADIAVEFYQERAIDFVTIVDLRSLAFYERPFARGPISDAGARTVRRINRQLTDEGLPTIDGLDEHIFLVTDPDGGITERYGVPDPSATLTCIIFDPSGMEIGRWDPAEDLDEVVSAIGQSLSRLPSAAREGDGE